METNRIEWLFQRYFDKSCTEAERAEFLELIATGKEDEAMHALLESKLQRYAPDQTLSNIEADALFNNIMQQADASESATVVSFSSKRSSPKKWWMAAAAVVAIASVNLWLWRHDTNPKPVTIVHAEPKSPVKDTIKAGGNRAMLTLADGSIVMLDSTGNGTIATQGNTKVLKTAQGELSYQSAPAANSGTVQYNTLTTPYGGQYKIKLPDGSKVWLNAASSIRYPTAFTGKNREVEIVGEAYFEVEKDAAHPFVVHTDHLQVEVLGTHFNLNSYKDEPASRTTLVEGSVRVSTRNLLKDLSEILKPGQQAQLQTKSASPEMNVRAVDVESVTAWKNGFFHFDGTPVQEVMRQISRWYDVDIETKGKLTKHFRGMLPRNASLEEVFHMLSLSGEFNYKIEGRTVMINL